MHGPDLDVAMIAHFEASPSGPTIIVIHQCFIGWFAKHRLARHQTHVSVHPVYRQTNLRRLARIEFRVIDIVVTEHIHQLSGRSLDLRRINTAIGLALVYRTGTYGFVPVV